MKYLILLVFLIGCATTSIPVMEDSFVVEPAAKNVRTFVMSEPTYNQIRNSLFSAEEAIDSLNSYVSRLEWLIFKMQYPNEARKMELEDEWEIYVIERGDNLSDIAFILGLPADALFNRNNDILSDPNLIYPKQVLKVRRLQNEN